jgi:hypothetical protein
MEIHGVTTGVPRTPPGAADAVGGAAATANALEASEAITRTRARREFDGPNFFVVLFMMCPLSR